MKVTVMGAVVVGTTAARSLVRAGAEVTVTDRHHSAAIERAARVQHLRLQDICRDGFSPCCCTCKMLRNFPMVV